MYFTVSYEYKHKTPIMHLVAIRNVRECQRAFKIYYQYQTKYIKNSELELCNYYFSIIR